MLRIDEAIEILRTEAAAERQLYDDGGASASWEQIANWLEELIRLRFDKCSTVEQVKSYMQGREDVINELKAEFDKIPNRTITSVDMVLILRRLREGKK